MLTFFTFWMKLLILRFLNICVCVSKTKLNYFQKRTVTELQSLVFASHTSLDELENRRSNMAGTVEDKLKSLTLPTPFLKGAFSNEIEAILNIPLQTLKTFSSKYVIMAF